MSFFGEICAGPVRSQGPCGGCYAMAIAAAVQGAIYKDFKAMGIPIPDDFELSPQGVSGKMVAHHGRGIVCLLSDYFV